MVNLKHINSLLVSNREILIERRKELKIELQKIKLEYNWLRNYFSVFEELFSSFLKSRKVNEDISDILFDFFHSENFNLKVITVSRLHNTNWHDANVSIFSFLRKNMKIEDFTMYVEFLFDLFKLNKFSKSRAKLKKKH